MHEMKKKYITEYGTENMSFLEEDSLLKGLRCTNEWKTLENQIQSVNKSIVELYSEYLEKECGNCNLKKDKIVALMEKFGLRTFNHHIAKAANCSKGYVEQFYPTIDGKILQKEYRKKISSKNRKNVLKRDNYSCIMCGSKENLQIHHINTVNGSYKKIDNNIDNLATLCKKCHYLAHNGNYWGITAYGNFKGGFWEWIRHSEKIRMEFLLKDIHGVGPVLMNRIYEKFDTLENLKKSNLNDLMEIKSISESLAKRIKHHCG